MFVECTPTKGEGIVLDVSHVWIHRTWPSLGLLVEHAIIS